MAGAERFEVEMASDFLSIITPAFNEETNLPVLYDRLRVVLDGATLAWEWVIVDDHSTDATFRVVRALSAADPRVRGVRLARNSGSHVALQCGLGLARGDAAIVLASDLQDPPETIPQLVERWRVGVKLVWAVREGHQGQGAAASGFSRLYHWLMRRVVKVREMPATGADFFLADRVVLDALKQFGETHVSLFALLTWMGFCQESIAYVKQARLRGRSGWNLEKKVKLVVDSVTSFTYLPIRLMTLLGFLTALVGFGYAGVVVTNALRGLPPQGWSSLMVAVLLLGGVQMTMLGVLGEYLWRALDEARRRPRYLIETTTDRAMDGRADRSVEDGPGCQANSGGTT